MHIDGFYVILPIIIDYSCIRKTPCYQDTFCCHISIAGYIITTRIRIFSVVSTVSSYFFSNMQKNSLADQVAV